MKCFHCLGGKNEERAHKSDATDSSGGPMMTVKSSPRSAAAASPRRSVPEMYEERAKNLRAFTYAELSRATCNFNKLLKIGEGGFGCVYKGSLKAVDGVAKQPTIVAVKKLNSDSHQGHKQWITEVQFLGIVNHPNYVKLIGYCAVDGGDKKQRLLVYEYVPNKSLDDHLFNRSLRPLPWERRLSIMLGAAQGLAYLHEELEIQVIYRDFKASNVLLDGEFRPKLSDFGLAREGPTEDNTHVSTNVVGTHGYAAPDYVETGRLTSKSDVWSYGVVLYEALTGRRSLETGRPKSERVLVDWVKNYQWNSGKFGAVMDPRLENGFPMGSAREVAKLADLCLSKKGKDRPAMSGVVEALKGIILRLKCGDDAAVERPLRRGSGEEKAEEMGLSESAKRRVEHLAKIGGSLGGVGRRRSVLAEA